MQTTKPTRPMLEIRTKATCIRPETFIYGCSSGKDRYLQFMVWQGQENIKFYVRCPSNLPTKALQNTRDIALKWIKENAAKWTLRDVLELERVLREAIYKVSAEEKEVLRG